MENKNKNNCLKLGTIKGRHEMPVKEYIINSEIKSELLNIYNFENLKLIILKEIHKIQNRYLNNEFKEIDLYLTGISRIQHLIIKSLNDCGINVNIYDFDKSTNNYFWICKYNGDKE